MPRKKRRLITCPDCGEFRAYKANGLCARCCDADWRRRHPGRVREYKRTYRLKNPEKVRAYNASYYREHREQVLACNRQWREGNAEKVAAYMQEWKQNNRDRVAAADARRRAKKARQPATLTAEQARRALSAGHCFYCEGHKQLGIDHFIPLDRGGGTTLANSVAACSRCNSAKGTKLPQDMLQQLAWLRK